MSLTKEQQEAFPEPLSDEHVRSFLNSQPEEGVDPDFHVLMRAYRSLRVEEFERFLAFFRQDGRNLEARDPGGRTLADILSRYPMAGPYLEALKRC